MSDEPFIAYCEAEYERLRNLPPVVFPQSPTWEGPFIPEGNSLATQQPKADPG